MGTESKISGARSLMFLGTGSDVGKSVLAAAFCRIFRQDGFRVAPFKAQNMALNSFITPEGGEMGRAQVVQAEAAGIEPHVDMNPILLKPTSEVGSQVILKGKVFGNYAADEYHRIKPDLVEEVMKSYSRLARNFDVMVLEGAGSPAEMNLKDADIVNLSMAERAGARVLLVADIDRGGVFAQIVGHMELFTPKERGLVAGFIINKFRGDVSLLGDGLAFLEKRTGRPVFGVVPQYSDIAIMEEDSVALSRRLSRSPTTRDGTVRVGVVRLPRISNYTDFEILAHDPRLSLSYVTLPSEIKGLHAVIIPGSKNTLADLGFLHETGFSAAITDFARRRGHVVGICGGLQMMGGSVADPLGVEGSPTSLDGLGLLPVATELLSEKVTTQVEASAAGLKWAAGSDRLTGYEIHMGRSTPTGDLPAAFTIQARNSRKVQVEDGIALAEGRVWGTYIHGLFDNDGFRESWITYLAGEYGLDPGPGPNLSFREWKELQYDRLADHVRAHVDVDAIYRVLGINP